MKSWRGTFLLLIPTLLLAACARQPPPLEAAGRAMVPAGSVEILWDEWGVPHVYGADEAATAFGFGWAQAHAHGDAILRLYAEARGTAAEQWGEEALESDRLVRTLGIAAAGEAMYAEQPPEFRAWLDAFAAGINAYGDRHPERLSAGARAVLPVTAADPLRHGRRLTFVFASLTSGQPQIVGMDGRPGAPVPGSNTWAIGPSRSASGNAMLLQNPHLPWDIPLMRFTEAHLNAPGLQVYGATLLGFPVMGIGFNRDLGWSHTVNTVDVLDAFTLRLDGDGYRFDGAARPFETRLDSVRVRGPDGSVRTETFRVRRSVHGPVVAMVGDTAALAIRTPVLERSGFLLAWMDMGRAGSLAEFEAVLRRHELPMFTVSYADRAGRIYYLFAGQVPRRPFGDFGVWQRPVRGDTSATFWTEILPFDSLPAIADPATGFLQNANSPPWFATYPSPFDRARYPDYIAPQSLSFREQRSIQLLLERPLITFDELVEMRHSTRMLLADRILDELVAAARSDGSAEALEAARVLESWDRRALPDSRGAALFTFWADQQCRGGTAVNPCGFRRAWDREAALETPAGLADPSTAVQRLVAAGAALQERAGALDVAWGAIMRARPDLPGRGAPGDPLGVFQVVSYAPTPDGPFRPVHGDTWVAVLEFTPTGPRGEVLLTYGNGTQPGFAERDQRELLARGRMRPLLFERSAVEAAAVRAETLRPGS